MTSFLLKMHIFPTPPPFNPKFETFPSYWITEILHAQVEDTMLIIRIKVFPQDPTISQGTFITDRRNRQTTTRSKDSGCSTAA